MPENKQQFHVESKHQVNWVDETIPFSQQFGDVYFSRHDGQAETGAVFIGGNFLTARWPLMQQCTIGETGFGTGLNFLETVRQWQLAKCPGARLHFISFEAFPLSRTDMQKSLRRWPLLASLAGRLAEIWHPQGQTIDQDFIEDVRLSVHLADAATALAKLEFAADAWYLDGFAPSRNPQMWSAELMQSVFDHTLAGGTFATYAAAGFVRRNLSSAGFDVQRQPGFGGKREMLAGCRPA